MYFAKKDDNCNNSVWITSVIAVLQYQILQRVHIVESSSSFNIGKTQQNCPLALAQNCRCHFLWPSTHTSGEGNKKNVLEILASKLVMRSYRGVRTLRRALGDVRKLNTRIKNRQIERSLMLQQASGLITPLSHSWVVVRHWLIR